MKTISEQGRFNDFCQDRNAELTLEAIKLNEMAEKIAGEEFIEQLQSMYCVTVGSKRHMFEMLPSEVKEFKNGCNGKVKSE